MKRRIAGLPVIVLFFLFLIQGMAIGGTVNALYQSGDVLAARMVKAEFESKNPGIKLRILDVPVANLYEKIMTTAVSKTGAYDVVEYKYPWIGALSAHFEPLTRFVKKYPEVNLDDFIPMILDKYGTWEETLYGLGFDGDVQYLHYRKDLFDQLGIAAPVTWGDALDAAMRFTQDLDGDGKMDVFGMNLMLQRNPEYVMTTYLNFLGAYGGKLLDENRKPVVNSREAMDALLMMKAFLPYCPVGTLNFGYMESLNAFLGGRTAMVQQWQIEMPAQDPKQSQIAGKYAATYMPGIRASDGSVRRSPALGGGWALGLMKDSKNKEEAFLWMMYEARPEVQKKVSLAATGVDPCRTSVYQDPEYTAKYKYLDMVGKNMAVGFAFPRIPEAATLNEMLSLVLSKALAGEVTPKKALDDAAKEWYKVLEEAGYY